jgi:hypothetical protein
MIPVVVRQHGWRLACVLMVLIACRQSTAESQSPGGLARRAGRLEEISGVESTYGVLATKEGQRLRTIVTRPRDARDRRPGILFVQWLSCGTIELPETSQDGWSRMLRRLIQESGFVVWRTEKAGVGDSEGDCVQLDYETEVSHHRQALRAFKGSRMSIQDESSCLARVWEPTWRR